MTANEAEAEVVKLMEPQERPLRAGGPRRGRGVHRSPAYETILDADRVYRRIREARAR